MTSHLRLALSVGVVGGVLFGGREALVALDANSFVQPGQYFWLYLAVPCLAWVVLGAVLMVPCGLIGGALARRRDARASFGVYAAVLAFAGGLSITWPWMVAVHERLTAVGSVLGIGEILTLWAVALATASVPAAVTGAAGAWYAARVERPLGYLLRVTLVASAVLLWPVIRFLASDWKWAVAPPASSADAAAQRPNVVLISIDTLRADHVGAYGDTNGLTPHLDRLASEGVTFEQTITSSPWTLPAMSSILTGADPHHHGAGRITNRRDPLGRSPLPTGTWTLATALRSQGYRTHAIVTNPYLALRYGLGEGFDGYENISIESEAFLAFSDTTAVRLLMWLRPELVVGDRGETVSARARRWLTQRATTRAASPFFLWVHYVDPHPPYSRARVNRHKSFRSDSLFAPRNIERTFSLTSPDVARLRSGEIRLSAEQKDAVRALYRAEVASVDAAVGSLLSGLEQTGLLDHTLVVCVADHGEEFWEHGGVEHGHTVYDELLRVPLLMRWPGRLPPGTRVPDLVRVTDIAPTVLDLIGGAMPTAPPDGASLLPLLQGHTAPPRIALSENLLFAEERVALRTSTHKYVRWDNGKEEVYDLIADPGEQRDRAGLVAAITPLRELYDVVSNGTASAPSRATQPTVDAAAATALRSLGYVQ